MRTMSNSLTWGGLGLIMILLAGNPVPAQEADDFNMPADGAKAADPAAPAADPGATPADPAESAGPVEAGGDVAPPAESGGDVSPPPANLDEPEQIELLSGKFKFTPGNESKDPFKPLVVKKVILPPAPTPVSKPSGPVGPPPPPPPKPIQLFVSGVCGNENERLAMIMFENKPYVVSKDMVVDGKFKVVDILPDRLVVYSNKEQMRRTFPIGGGKE